MAHLSNGSDSDGSLSRADRIGLVLALSAAAYLAIAMVSFGTKTACTSTLDNDCDSIDSWAWATLIGCIAIALVAGWLASSKRRASMAIGAVAVTAVVGSAAMVVISRQ